MQLFAPGMLKGKVAMVTGGGSGIGLAIADTLARSGADVAICSRKKDRLVVAAEALRHHGTRILPLALDVRSSQAVDETVATIVSELGGLDILVNNAAGNFFAPSVAMTDNAFNAVIGIDLNGTFYCSRAAGRVMIERGEGRIISITATLAEKGFPGMVHMTSAKAGIEAMTKTLAAEWGPMGVRVNCVSPGPVMTEGVRKAFLLNEELEAKLQSSLPLGRYGEPSEIANVVAFLAGPGGAWVTGATWTIDGGELLGQNMLKLVMEG